jgi:hypothetical protein
MITDTKIELLHSPGCPNLDGARALLASCISELGLAVTVIDRETDYPSPTILVNGIDVMGRPESEQPGCRLDLPTRERILEALQP